MKQILTILFLSITSIAFSQSGTKGTIKVQNNGSSVDSNFINSKLVEKLNISDTAAMLAPYISTAVANATYATIANLAAKANDNEVLKLTGGVISGRLKINTSLIASLDPNTLVNDTAQVSIKDNSTRLSYLSRRLALAILDSLDRQTFTVDAGGEANVWAYSRGAGAIFALGNFPAGGVAPNDFNHYASIFSNANYRFTGGSIISRIFDTSTTSLKTSWEINLMDGVNATGQGHANTNLAYIFLPTGFYIPNNKKIVFNNDVAINSSGTGILDVAGSLNVYNNVYGNKLIKSGGTSSQLLKADGSVAAISSLPVSTATQTALNAKLDTSYHENNYMYKPLYIVQRNDTAYEYHIDTMSSTKDGILLKGGITADGDTLATKADVRSMAGSGTGMPDLSSRDYDDDSSAIVDGGLKQWEWYRTGNLVKVVTKTVWDYYTSMFRIVTDSANTQVKFLNYSPVNFTFTAYWDNHNQSDIVKYSGNYTYDIAKNFGTKQNRITAFSAQNINNIREISLDSVSDFANIYKFPNLYKLTVTNSNIAGLNGNPNNFNDSLKVYNVYNCPLYSSIDFDGLPTAFEKLEIQGCNSLATFLNLDSIPTGITIFNVKYCDLSVANINDILVALDAITFTGTVSIDLRQGAGRVPTGAGLTAKNNLITKGYTVLTD